MKIKSIKTLLVIFLISTNLFSQNSALNVKQFKLDNGLTVFLNPDNNANGTYGLVVIKAGSKNDPSDATGLAHYLEHLLFKGTTEMGTTDYAKEKPFLDSIVYYYDLLGKTNDNTERKRIQKLINNQSVQSAKYANPTEFDKLIKSIGGTGLNAFTATDMTVYHNAFPGEQVEKWLELYAHRFHKPVFRSFQSELEVVYEEKNKGMDNPYQSLYEEVNKKLFKYHPYGTQTTIGTTEHLKNPSLTKMYQFFNDYYVPNNMAIVLSGNFDPISARKAIETYFSTLVKKEIPQFPNHKVSTFEKQEVLELNYTPINYGLVAYKTFPKGDKDELGFELCNKLLLNESQTGILNQLKSQGKVLFITNVNLSYADDGAYMISYGPKTNGLSFQEVEKQILDGIEKLKNGNFSDTNLLIIKQEIRRKKLQELESEYNRAMALANLFTMGTSWDEYLKKIDRIDAITKEDIVKLAQRIFQENLLFVRSSVGNSPKETLNKPGFEAVKTDQKIPSIFAEKFLQTKIEPAQIKYIDYDKDCQVTQIGPFDKLYQNYNPYNELFTLKIQRKVGSDTLKYLDFLPSVISYLHSKNYDLQTLKKKFAMLGINYQAGVSNNRLTYTFEGFKSNLETAIPIINDLLTNPILDEQYLKNTVDAILTNRVSELKDPTQLGSMLFNACIYGDKAPAINRLSSDELKKIKTQDIVNDLLKSNSYETVWHFIGNISIKKLKSLISKEFKTASTKGVLLTNKEYKNIPSNTIYYINDPKAVQSQVFYALKTPDFKDEPKENVKADAFNTYLSDGFSGLLMQEIREFRSLAYTTSGSFNKPYFGNSPGIFYAYVGCQSDKTNDAVQVLDSLIRFMPSKPERIESIKLMLKNSSASSYPNFRSLSSAIDFGKQLGFKHSPKLDEYPLYGNLTFDDVYDFYKQNIQNQQHIITIYGNMNNIDKEKLKTMGNVVELSVSDIRKN
jgi:predicted Zn-dependent peptidase